MTYYLKYRPQKIKELDLEDVRETIASILDNKEIPHAFLFSGPKGTGKTSTARIVAKAVNCLKKEKGSVEPCNECEQCTSITSGSNIDVIEMDAASHRGIDDVRALKDAAKLSPANATKKVYIIDEAHMLTTEASNALLKTLEEPPSHVMFILATTNPEKLIPTIRSRTTQVKFKKATVKEITSSLEKIVKAEKLDVEDGVLEFIADSSDGSFRDADKLLEQLAGRAPKITLDNAKQNITSVGNFDAKKFLHMFPAKDAKEMIEYVNESIENGVSADAITDSISVTVRNALLHLVGVENLTEVIESSLSLVDLLKILKLFVTAKENIASSFIEQIPLEIAIVEWCDKQIDGNETQLLDEKEVTKENVDTKKLEPQARDVEGKKEKLNGNRAAPIEAGALHLDKKISKDEWAKILSEIRPQNASTEALLRAAYPMGIDGNTLMLGVYYSFHKEHLESNSHRRLLEDVCGHVLGGSIAIKCLLTKPPADKIIPVQTAQIAVKADAPQAGLASNSAPVLTEEDDKDILKIAEELFGE